jgi:integrase
MKNNELLKNIFVTYNHSPTTQKAYVYALKQYSNYFDMDLHEFLREAEDEENRGIKWKHRKIKTRLLEFRQHYLTNYALNTTRSVMMCVTKFYKFYDIEIYSLPKINQKSIRKPQPIYYSDLPDKEIIREAVSIATPVMKAAILFICSSGCARAETLSLKIQDYIDALSEYLPRKDMDIFEIIDLIEDDDTVVPTFNIRRKKTNKYYTTYCSPEAVKAINAHILSRTDNVTNDSKLFKMAVSYFSVNFQKINNDLGLGKVGNYNRFRSHMLRKFHASALYNDGMSLDDVNDLQGKSKSRTDQAYFMINPEDLKYEYIEHLPAVTISTDVKKLHVKSPEFVKIENEKNELKSELDRLRADIDSLKGMIGK